MMLLIDLVKDCPFDVMRIGSFSLVRELLSRKFEVRSILSFLE